jgi:transcriptional regulator with XRE-family HTH domain
VETFGQALRRLRESRSLSLRALSALVNYDWGYLGQIERGQRQPTAELVRRLDRALDAAGGLVEAFQQRDADPDRRAVLRALSALTFGAPTVAVALEAIRHGLDLSMRPDVDDWEEITAGYGRAFYTTDHEVLLEQVTADLAVLQQMLAAALGRRRRGLAASAGRLSVVVAMLTVTTGRQHLADRWWRSARAAADESGDVDTAVFVRAWEVVHGPYERRPLAGVIALGEQAAALADGRSGAAVAGLHAGRAQALALAGRGTEAGTALRAVETATERLPASVTGDQASMFGWPEERLRHTESYVYSHLGDTARAAAAQDRAAALYLKPQARLRAQVDLHRARCLIADGDVADGLRHAAAALDSVPPAQHNELLYQVARQVVEALPAKELSRAEVDELVCRLPGGPA